VKSIIVAIASQLVQELSLVLLVRLVPTSRLPLVLAYFVLQLTLNANFVQPVFAQAANKAITRLLTVLASFATQQFQTVSSANLPTTQCSAHSASEAMVSTTINV
jgi:hypothetical protein